MLGSTSSLLSHEATNYIHLKCDLHNVIIFKSKDSLFDLDAANV